MVVWRTVGAKIAVAAAALALVAAPATAQPALRLVTGFTDVNVGAGRTVSFDVDVVGSHRRVDLRVGDVPDGWDAVLLGGGSEIGAAFADPDDPPRITLRVKVPRDTEPDTYTLTVVGTGGGLTDVLELTLRVSGVEEGDVRLESDFPVQRGTSTDAFSFDATLHNDGATAQAFALDVSGPRTWTLTARAGGRTGMATVDAGSFEDVTVAATPPNDVDDGEYPVTLTAEAPDGTRAEIGFTAIVSGRVKMVFVTADERLNTSARTAAQTRLPLEVRNEGSEPLTNVFFTSAPPVDWEVVYEPSQIDTIEAGETAEVTAFIRPSENAVPGDYSVTLTANGPVDENFELRVSVRQGAGSGLFGLAVIVATVLAIRYAFRRYGRR